MQNGEVNKGKSILFFISNLPLRTKLFFAFIIIGIIPIICSGYLFYHKSYKVILDNSRDYTEEMLLQINNNLSVKIDNIDAVALSIITNNSIKSLLNEKDDIKRGQNTRTVEAYLRNTVLSSKDINDIIIIDKNLNNYETGSGFIDRSFDFPHSLYYSEMLKGRGRNIWTGFTDNIAKAPYPLTNVKVFPSVSVIKDFYNDIYLGGLIVNLNKSAITNIINNVYTGEKGNILILDKNMRYMVSTKDLGFSLKNEYFNKINQKLDKGSYIERINGEENLVTYIKNEETGWHIVSLMTISDLVKTSGVIKDIILKVTFLFVLLCIVFSIIISFNITKGIKKLINIMGLVKKGDLNVRMNSEREDEIGILSNNFDNMVGRLNELIRTKYELELRENQAQLKVLQAQLSPHFLYNALDSINWMLIEKDQMEISSAVVMLGDLLRYSVSNGSTVITVSEEIHQVRNYLALQKIRFEDRFVFYINIDEEIMEQLIPKFIIQPIVENAVIHGIEDYTDKGCINVSGYTMDNCLIFKIEDNGKGIEAQDLEVLRRHINNHSQAENKEASETHAHIGIENVNQRIKIIYGEEYGLNIESEYSKGTKVTIKLPIDTMGV